MGCLSCAPYWGPGPGSCARTENRTGNPQVRRLALNPLSHTSQGLFIYLKQFFKDYIYLFLERGRKRGRETSMRERYIDWLPLAHPQVGTWLGTWLSTQACALTGNRTGGLSVLRLELNPLSQICTF